MENKEKKNKRISALDVFAVFTLLLCIAGLVARLIAGRDGVLPEKAPERGEYAVSFEIARTRASSELTSGEVFYAADDSVFGTLSDQFSVTPAAIYKENSDGTLVLTYSSSEGDSALVDIRGTMTVEGYPVDYGFLAGGRTFISPNYTLTLHTDKMTTDVRITDVSKIGD